MSLFANTAPPAEDTHDTLREWRMQSFGQRYWVALMVMLRLISVVVLIAGIGLFISEPSWRSVTFTIIIWLIAIPLTALGYVKKVDRMAALVPSISSANPDPTTTVDIRRNSPNAR